MYRPIVPVRRARAKLVVAALMGVSTLATALFIHAKLSSQEPAQVAVAAEPEADEAAPTTARATTVASASLGATRSISLAAPVAADPFDEDVDALGHQDPRWVRNVTPAPTAKPNPALARAAAELADSDETLAYASPETDGGQTAAISPDPPKPRVVEEEEPEPEALSGGQATKILRAVNLRSSPRSGSRVIRVLPAGATVDLYGCKGWCEVSYQGSRGFIYKSFIGRGQAASAKPRQAKAKVAEQKPVERKFLTLRQ